jgi:hypothetical protein
MLANDSRAGEKFKKDMGTNEFYSFLKRKIGVKKRRFWGAETREDLMAIALWMGYKIVASPYFKNLLNSQTKVSNNPVVPIYRLTAFKLLSWRPGKYKGFWLSNEIPSGFIRDDKDFEKITSYNLKIKENFSKL